VRLSDAGLTLGDVDLGGIDAESDYKLDEYFVNTPYVSSVLAGRRTLFLGRKGSGKSAVFRQLPRLVTESRLGDILVAQVTPDEYAWATLKQYREQGILPEQAHTNAWRLTLAVEVAAVLLAEDRQWLPQAEASLRKLRSFLADNFGSINPSLVQTATSILKGLKAFNVSAFGFGVGTQLETPEQPVTPAVVNEIWSLLADPLREAGVLIAIDRLDDSWDGSPEAQSLLVGLLKAAKDLNDSFGLTDDGTGLRVLVFLRSDIYDALRFDDKDKHRATEEQIIWTSELLKEMLERRLPRTITVDELFEPGDMRGSISPFNYIVRRTFLRPREVLQFVDECVRVAGAESTQIRKDDIRTAEERYSRWKVSDLKQEFFKVFPDFDRLLECLRQEVHRYDAMRDLELLIAAKAPDLSEMHGGRHLLEILFEYSVIGVRIGDAGSTRFKCEEADLALPQSGAIYVHQSLYRGMNIRETRRMTADEEAGSLQDRVSVELYRKMLSALPMQDLTFLNTQPTPVHVLEQPTFADCAGALGISLEIDETEQRTATLARPNVIARGRFDFDSRIYLQLKGELLATLRDFGISPDAYVREERRANGVSNGGVH
jgi:energy-coupling factor transporter ATP-binding protein EcfA2